MANSAKDLSVKSTYQPELPATVMSIVRAAAIQRLQCPYCHSSASVLYCFQAISLTVEDFGLLLQLGWCRCGSLIYRPDPQARCCPQFSMRIQTNEFSPNAKQKKVIRRLAMQPHLRYLGQSLESSLKALRLIRFSIEYPYPHWFLRTEKGVARSDIVATLVAVIGSDGPRTRIRDQLQHLIVHELLRFPHIVLATHDFDGTGSLFLKLSQYDCCSFCDCSVVDHDNWRDHLIRTVSPEDSRVPYWKTICIDSEALEKWESTATRPPKLRTIKSSVCTRHERHRFDGEWERPRSPSLVLFDETMCDGLEISMEPCTFSEEKFQLYLQYQLLVHDDIGDSSSREKFEDSMVRTPILSTDERFGSFHRCYRRKDTGELIAFTLLDLVPDGLNSQYFVWSQKWRQLNLGIFSILDEIKMIEQKRIPYGIRPFLYLGIYVESCSKMLYKKQFKPSELRRPSGWSPTELALSAFEYDTRMRDPLPDNDSDLNYIPMESINDDLLIRADYRIAEFGQLKHQAKFTYYQFRELYLFCQFFGHLSRRFVYVLQ